MKPRFLITGMGLSTSLGEGVQANWESLTQAPSLSRAKHGRGRSPEVWRPGEDKSNVPSSQPSPDTLVGRRGVNGLLRATGLSEQASLEALREAGLLSSEGQSPGLSSCLDPDRFGSTVSASKPLFRGDIPESPDVINDFVRQRFGLRGESRNVIAACATGVYSVAIAASWIEQGLCDLVLAGSVEPYPHPLVEAGFHQMGVMSSDGVTRPFDRRRSGFTFGEGAGILVLESEQHARNRGARPQAVLSGRALGSDSHSAFAFNSQGGKSPA